MAHNKYELGLGLTEEHSALADSVRAFAERTITTTHIRDAVEAKTSSKFPEFWQALVDQDLLGLLAHPDQGGFGAGLLTLSVALEALGRTPVPGPFLPTVLAVGLLAGSNSSVGQQELPGLLDGTRTAAVTLEGHFHARRTSTGHRVEGYANAVLGGEHADVVIVPVRFDDDTRWTAIRSEDFRVTPQDSIDLLRGAARIDVDGAATTPAQVLTGLDVVRARAIVTVIACAEALGVMSWCVSAAADYARSRVQFGRPIGQFQGVKHKCARMGINLEKARAVLWDAASAIDKDDDTADVAADIAAAVIPDAAVEVAEDCIQVHGGIGFTWEHDAHLYYRRALSLRGLLGTNADRVDRVAEAALARRSRGTTIQLPPEAATYRAAVAQALESVVAIADEDERLTALGDGGWVQPHLPKPYGRGAGPLEQIVISQELEAAGITMPQLLMGGWAVSAIVAHGTEQQKQTLAIPTLRAELVWCQLFSEPEAGSDLAALRTRAEKVEGGWKINGQKIWTTVAQFSDWAMLIARSDPSRPKHQGITYFVLDMSSPGVTVRPLREMTGSALFNEVFLDDVFIPDENVVGEVNDGWQVARSTLAGERVALSQKMEAYATDADLMDFVEGRQLDPVGKHRFGELIAESQAIDLIGSRVVLQQLSGADVSTSSSAGKMLSMALGQSISEFVVAQLGSAGTVSVPGEPSDKAMEQLLAGRATTIYGGTTEVQLNVIGERMLGLPRDTDR